MPKLVIVLDVDADRTVADPHEIAQEALDIHPEGDQNHPFGATFVGAEWADNGSDVIRLIKVARS